MGNAFAGTIYIVVASNGDHNEFWAAATPKHRAAEEVQSLLPWGWTARFTGWRLSAKKGALLKMRANSVLKLEQAPR
jgi:hypothetical protein